MILNLVPHTDQILSEPIDEFDFANPSIDPVALAYSLVETVTQLNGLGLAANQCGHKVRAFVLVGDPYYVCYNPKIVDVSEEQIYLEEGCLSYPNVVCKIKRPSVIKVRFTAPNSEVFTKKFIGMTARAFQHELDHLDGINFLQRATLYHREQALKRAKKLNRRSNGKN